MERWLARYIPNPEWRLIVVIAAIFSLLRVVTSLTMYWEHALLAKELDFWPFVHGRVVAWFVAMVFVVVIVKTTNRFLIERLSWSRIIGIHLGIAVIMSLLWYTTYIAVMYLFCQIGECKMDQEDSNFLAWYLQNFNALFILYLLTASLTYTYYYIRRDHHHRMRQSKMEQQLLTTRLMALKSQLHPHFLFNTLNSIVALVEIDADRAKNMIADLSGLLRRVLEYRDDHLIRLHEELDLLQKYLDIEKVRFSEHLEIDLEVESGLDDLLVPALLLQPLVENSIQHGFSAKHPQLRIQLRIFRQADRLFFVLTDDGKGLLEEDPVALREKGVGLRNTFERLSSLYEDDFRFEVKNQEQGVVNFLDIPAQTVPALV
ncbi:MAG: histidine kinase [Saprospiraceae bacterium]|nr:histidine kinase [Saprospiraceae bacterium]